MCSLANRKIKLTVGEKVITASLNESPASRDFIRLLPLVVTMGDYAGKRKIQMLPEVLSIEGASDGCVVSSGDIAYYAPWRNLTIFYNGGGYAKGCVSLGQLDSDVEVFNVPGPVRVRIEKI